ncbi:hypothetical protein T4D_9741 [Trichinella pseudospiralis]|uniref:Uncharacterized protein n=1 Tax=Trichinella pseudospiralis TaxID=6337 RepID=A0A0V1G1Q4_TRIPS|nr:hypothetical protein T4D_9741 [Trichinella pseudospiralis]
MDGFMAVRRLVVCGVVHCIELYVGEMLVHCRNISLLSNFTQYYMSNASVCCYSTQVLKTPENALLIPTNYGKLSNKSGSPCNAVRRLHKRLIKTTTPSGALIMRIRAWQPRAYDYQINVHDLRYSRQKFRASH